MGQRRFQRAVPFLGPVALSQGALGISADGVGFHGYEHRLDWAEAEGAPPSRLKLGVASASHEAQLFRD